MMREIKFRAWHRDLKSYIGTDEYVIDPYNGEVADVNGYEILSVNDDSVLEQFTGLTDMNNSEIYEGDIVKLHVVILSPDDKVGIVEYIPKYGYCINFGGKVARQEYWSANDKHTIEVIGNIHENPELLEEK